MVKQPKKNPTKAASVMMTRMSSVLIARLPAANAARGFVWSYHRDDERPSTTRQRFWDCGERIATVP
jgi:hypothetical protein